ncbi:MAG: CBS domain-containing protein [Armatimonadota bacterium]
MQASEIMTESPVCCTPSDTVQSVAVAMRDNNCGLLPVVDNKNNSQLVGVITDRDIVCRVVASMDCNTATVANAMTTGNIWMVRPDASLDEVIDKMEEGQVRRIPVVDENNRILGVISVADIALEIDEPEEIAEVIEEISEPTNTPHA